MTSAMTFNPVISMLAQAEAGQFLVGPFMAYLGAMLVLGLAAFGSAVGIGRAGQAAAGAWAREAKAGKTLRFTYIILVGMPISQTLYALILMLQMPGADVFAQLSPAQLGLMVGIGLAAGLAEMLSAWMQGAIGAAGIRALSEGEGKGFAFIIIAMGIAETVGIFALVFYLMQIPTIG